jgi:hypothetical protein
MHTEDARLRTHNQLELLYTDAGNHAAGSQLQGTVGSVPVATVTLTSEMRSRGTRKEECDF